MTALKSSSPPIWVIEHRLAQAELVFELVQVTDDELEAILRRLSELLAPAT